MADIHTVGVIGGGVMGSGIAQVCALAGLSVIVVEADEKAAAKARENLETGRFGLERAVQRGKIQPADALAAKGRVHYVTDKKKVASADLVIEAVPEDKNLKKQIFTELDGICESKTILATNTSGFAISELAEAVSRKDKFLGMHFFSPVPIMHPVEIVYSPQTSDETFQAARQLTEKIGKTPIRVKDAPGKYGFVANRIYFAMLKEAQAVLAEGIASMEDIDAVMRLGYNWPVGPFGMIQGAKGGWKK